jgi:hypothetical protein
MAPPRNDAASAEVIRSFRIHEPYVRCWLFQLSNKGGAGSSCYVGNSPLAQRKMSLQVGAAAATRTKKNGATFPRMAPCCRPRIGR